MKDLFPIPPIPWLSSAVQPLADALNLPTLPLHIHEVLGSALLYSVIFWPISPMLSRVCFPKHYPQLSRARRLNWDAHVVSMVQSIMINGIALWVLYVDPDRKNNDWEHRIWAYTGADAMVQAMAAGYFLWDLVVTSMNLHIFGLGTLAHAISALAVYSLGFKPFLNHYACIFILWELSTPFLNIHWFLDKLNMTGSKLQLYNGMMLIFTFFTARLVFGTWQSFLAMRDIWASINVVPPSVVAGTAKLSNVYNFTTVDSAIPIWLGAAYLASNLTLNSLNFYWFIKMIQAVTKRFTPAKTVVVEKTGSGKSSSTAVKVDAETLKRRKAGVEEERALLDEAGL
ncbi:hypothetical protein TD95_003366 [Thielaviopsis punctulata]|uniref:TLC domain-containing protein n=1 Tax=Thielaviopsis punctulata TaxID=72032 RepID=A0A0F4ZJ08_9PEZI|nr:hypothetical protein TD95_003366 [Thielaviopsis punctulata]